MNLNPEQQAVVESDAKKILCISGAGSGKSTVLCARIQRLVSEGADPSKFIVVTFTNAAARVLQERLEGIKLGSCSTLHALCLRLIMQHHDLLNLPKTLSVCDEETGAALLETIMAELGCKSPMKQMLPLLNEPRLIQPATGRRSCLKAELCVIELHNRLRESGLLTFDTILFYAEKLIPMLENITDMGGMLSGTSVWPYTHLFADEIQDSADIDWRLYDLMPVQHRFMVGDDSQAIYQFRGGNVKNMLRIASGAPENGWSVMSLILNHRCRAAIVAASDRLIAHNPDRHPKTCEAVNRGGTVSVTRCDSPAAELAHVLNKITGIITGKEGIAASEVALVHNAEPSESARTK